MSKWTKKQKKVMKKISEASVATETNSRYKFKFISALYDMSKLGVNIKQASKDRYQTEGCYYPLLSIYTTNALQDSIIELLQAIHDETDMNEFKSKYIVYRNSEGNYWDITGETCRLTHVHDSLLWRARYDYDRPITMSLNHEDGNTFNCVEIDISGDLIHDEDAYYDFCEYFNKHATWLYTAISPAYWSFNEISIEHRDSTNRDEEFADFLADIFGTYPSWTPEEYKKSKHVRRRKKDASWFNNYIGRYKSNRSDPNHPKLKVVMPMPVEKQEAFGKDLLNVFNSRTLANGSTKPPFKFVRDIDKKYGNHIRLIATEMMNMIWSDIRSYSFDLKDAAYLAADLTKRFNDVDYVLVTKIVAPSYEYVSHLTETGELTKEALEEFGGCWTNHMSSSDTISVYTADGKTIDKTKDECAGYIPVIDIYFGTFDELRLNKLPPIDCEQFGPDVVDIAVCNALNRFANGVYWRPMYDNTSSDDGTSCRRYYPSKPLSVSSGNVKTTPADLENDLAAVDELVEMSGQILKDPDNGYIRDIEQAGIEVARIDMFIPKYHDMICAIDNLSLDPRVIDTYNGIWTGDSLTVKSRSYISKNMKRCYRPLDKTAGFLPFVQVVWKHKD